jgi:hypothetical protein
LEHGHSELAEVRSTEEDFDLEERAAQSYHRADNPRNFIGIEKYDVLGIVPPPARDERALIGNC